MKFGTFLTICILSFSMALAGCSNNNQAATEQEASENFNDTGMPIVNEPIKIKFMTGKAPTTAEDYNQVAVWEKYEEMTNIQIDWGLVQKAGLKEKRNLALASGDYPEVFYSAGVPVTDLAKYSKQGVFLQLDDLIDQHMPNLKKRFEEYPSVKQGLTLPDGHIYSLPTIYSFDALQMSGVGWVRQDWLEQLNMDLPETTDEYYEYLKAVSTTDLNGNGKADEIPYGGKGISGIVELIEGSFGLGNRGYHHNYVDTDPNTGELRFFR
ncbi:extracellular solute-binding protein [Litoribacterium kuwaitense]|uniref:extracellular solute-binding protein n=1 Tax=Litoribacterium kuwaitense TaxID=1398745 RepID=UPI001FE88632|nr:extracellular solute-binding protein [Litoribacterium kuwaitense]